MELLKELNDQQRRAVEAGDGSVLIVAGPGTGKTKTLTTRIAHLLEVRHVKPEEIIALTFTNKAAREMRERVQKLLGKDETLPKITTFHALGHDLLRQQGSEQRLLNESERQELMRALTKPPELKHLSVRELSLYISRAKTALQKPDKPTKQLLERYEQALADQKAYDFDDLLVKAHELLQVDEQKRPQYTHVLVDEFQDTSDLQYELLKLLSREQNYFAIGDPNQSIYAFRGAGAETFDKFRADFANIQEIDLTENYRSRPEIVSLANAMFPDSPQLHANTQEAGTARAIQTLNEYSEAAYIINQTEQGIGGSDMLKATGDQDVREPRDYAILYRTHRAARTVQKAIADSGIPYQIAGEGSPYESPELQAIVAIMRHIHDPKAVTIAGLLSQPSLQSHSPALLKTLLVKLYEKNSPTVADLASNIAETVTHFPAQNLQQFVHMLVQFGPIDSGLGKALQHIDDIAASEFYDPSINAVTLLTIHAAKGLEFAHVFLVATEEGVLPKISKTTEPNIDEERRLFYVAVTRAKSHLNILYTKTRASQPATPSRFITGPSNTTLPRIIDPSMPALEKRLQKRTAKRAQTSLF